MIQLISVMSELGAGTRGASLGMDALEGASHLEDFDFFLRFPPVHVEADNSLLKRDVVYPAGKRIEGIVKMYDRISRQVQSTVREGNFPLIIAGDHSNSGGTLAGLREAHGDKRIGVVWIDAHADLHSIYTSPSGNIHGMPLATAIHDDNLECKVKEPAEAVVEAWNELKGKSRRINPEDIVFISLRDTEPPEDYLVEKYNMGVYRTLALHEKGCSHVVRQTLKRLSDCDLIYVSFDVDSMDPTVSVGTGTPVPGGLAKEEARDLLKWFATNPKVCCIEFTEINPLLDKKANSMGRVAFDLLRSTISALQQRGV